METYKYTFDQLEERNELFSSKLENDYWILYHVTTSISECDIDQHGLSTCNSSSYDNETRTIIRIFRAMNWAGDHMGGYGVLRAFSSHRGSSNELYFREYSTRSLTYAHADFVGGETVRALHYALDDLRSYIEKPEFRERHYAAQVAQCKELVEQGNAPSHVIRVDEAWVRQQLDALQSLSNRIATIRSEYEYGVVYAVRFEPSDLPHLSIGDGIICSMDVAATRIEGKASLYLQDQKLSQKYYWIERSTAIEGGPGVFHSLKALKRPTMSYGDFGVRERSWQVMEFAGQDDALEIAERYGTPAVKARIKAGVINFTDYI